jgi:hypothetical protein
MSFNLAGRSPRIAGPYKSAHTRSILAFLVTYCARTRSVTEAAACPATAPPDHAQWKLNARPMWGARVAIWRS